MPAAIKLQEEFEDILQVVFVEVGRVSRDQMVEFAANREWLGGQAMWTKHKPFETGLGATPSYGLLSDSGELLAKGITTREHHKIVELIEGYEKQRKKGPDDAPRDVAKLVANYHKGKVADALSGLEALIADPGRKDPELVVAAATAWRDTLTAWVERDLTRLGWLIDNGRYELADERIDDLQKALKGNETFGTRLSAFAEALDDPALDSERKAEEALAKLERKLFEGGTEKFKEKALEDLIHDFPGTHAARRAEEWLPLASS